MFHKKFDFNKNDSFYISLQKRIWILYNLVHIVTKKLLTFTFLILHKKDNKYLCIIFYYVNIKIVKKRKNINKWLKMWEKYFVKLLNITSSRCLKIGWKWNYNITGIFQCTVWEAMNWSSDWKLSAMDFYRTFKRFL